MAEVHHLTYERIFQEDLADLQGLCEFCHAFLHEKRPDDGAAVYETAVREREELLKPARAEIARYESRPQVYRSFSDGSFASHRELIALLRANPKIISAISEGAIVDVRYAKRKYDSAVTFNIRCQKDGGEARMHVRSAEELLYEGRLVLDTERHLWVEIDNIRRFVKHYSARFCP